MASLVTEMVKNLPAMQEMWVQSLGQEDSLEIYIYMYVCVCVYIYICREREIQILFQRNSCNCTVGQQAREWTLEPSSGIPILAPALTDA